MLDTELPRGFAAALQQPVVELQRRDAVLLVVALDGVEDALIAGVHPALELEDRLRRRR